MNKNPKTERPVVRPLFVAELGSISGGGRHPYPRGPILTTRSSLEGGSDSSAE